MVNPERLPVRNREQRDAHVATAAVHVPFHVHGHGRRALVENGKLRAVVEQTGHLSKLRTSSDHYPSAYRNALLLSATEDVHPVLDAVPSAFSVENVSELNPFQVFTKVLVTNALSTHIRRRIRIDHLIPQCA